MSIGYIRQVVPTSQSIPVSLGTLGRPEPTLSQHRYLLSCRTKGFPTPANFEVNLSEIGCSRQKKELQNPIKGLQGTGSGPKPSAAHGTIISLSP